MSQGFITLVIPFEAARIAAVNGRLAVLGRRGRPPPPFWEELDACGFVHFFTLQVVPAPEAGERAHLVAQICADGAPREALSRLAALAQVPAMLADLLRTAGIGLDYELGVLLESYRREFGSGLQDRAGLAFMGTPGLTVERIRQEAYFAAAVRELLRQDKAPGYAWDKLSRVRNKVFSDVELKWAFVSEPVPMLGDAKPITDSLGPLIWAAFRDFLWPLIPFPVAVILWSRFVWHSRIDSAAWHFVLAAAGELALAGLAVLIGYWLLRRAEQADAPFDAEPGLHEMREILRHENYPGDAQNHLSGVSILKPGLVRYVTLRLALWLIGESGTRRSKPGFLDKIGTIHFAQWLQLPGTRQLVFLSNYDGSWQSYLEDFIARLRAGLSSVWSNTRDFPKTANLVSGGAGDGARFKRWARRQQIPTLFWYSAYPHLTTSSIRTNAAIRHGFAAATNEEDAARWLTLFGYAAPESVDAGEIPTLAFGSLTGLPCARCLVVRLGEAKAARAWLAAIKDKIWYGEHLPTQPVLAVGFTCMGLRKLGLDDATIATFPNAFQDGMSSEGRARALGDDPLTWKWGKVEDRIDAVVIAYAGSASGVKALVDATSAALQANGGAVADSIALRDLPEKEKDAKRRKIVEPFGFRDGISQPVMRGARDRTSGAANVIEPGELVLGYRDTYGNVAPTPRRGSWDIGRNGTYLVVRQLEQDTKAFESYISGQAVKLNGDARVPNGGGVVLKEWIAAKMVGRWRDGTSLVMHPDKPGTMKDPDAKPDNAFMFGRDDPDGLRCPLGAHIRRANPRDSFDPGSKLQIEITDRHRILRVGRRYEPAAAGGNPGLLFMCVNADIERQFEFLQQTWLLGPNFHGLDNEVDPIVGGRGAMTVPTPRGPICLEGLGKFVTMLGGGYFFMPGKTAVDVLAAGAVPVSVPYLTSP